MESFKHLPIICFVILLSCHCTIVNCTDSCINQLNNFKRVVRDDFNYVNQNVETLSKNLHEMNISIQACTEYCIRNSDNNANKNNGENNANNDDIVPLVDGGEKYYYHNILKAFTSEKRLNRQLQNQIELLERRYSDMKTEFEIRIDGIYEDLVNNMTSFMAYVNATLEKRVEDMESEKSEVTTTVSNARTTTLTSTSTLTVPTTTLDTLDVCNVPRSSGVYNIYITSLELPKTVYCDADTDDGGWIVIMRRQDGSVDFDRSWDDYKNGFGNVAGEFWIGNDFIHKLTNSKSMELRIDMEDFDGNRAFAKYGHFQIGSEDDQYRLSIGSFNGTAGDSLNDQSRKTYIHNGMMFSTYDVENDLSGGEDCALKFGGGWWFNSCFRSNLNGRYSIHVGSFKRYYGIVWESWLGWENFPKFVEMKIR